MILFVWIRSIIKKISIDKWMWCVPFHQDLQLPRPSTLSSFEFDTCKLRCAAKSKLNWQQNEYCLGVHLGCDIILNGCYSNNWLSTDQSCHTNPTRFYIAIVFQYKVNSIEFNSIVWPIDAALCALDLMTGMHYSVTKDVIR